MTSTVVASRRAALDRDVRGSCDGPTNLASPGHLHEPTDFASLGHCDPPMSLASVGDPTSTASTLAHGEAIRCSAGRRARWLARSNLLQRSACGRLALLLSFGLVGCGSPPQGVRAEPASLVFTPAAGRLELQLVNHRDSAVPLSRIRFDSRLPDWGAFTIENRDYPREIAAGGAVSLRLRVDHDHFTRRRATGGGGGRLLFAAGDSPQTVELRYERPDGGRDLRRTGIRTALLLGIVALAWAATRRARLAWTAWLPALVVLALLPFGPGLCVDDLGRALTAADLDQCADGRGGEPLTLLAVGEGWLLYLLVLVLAGLGRLGEATGLARRLASRDLALAAAFAGPLLFFGTFDPRRLVGEQAIALVGGAAIPPSWGIFVQPIAAAVAIAVAAGPPAARLERLAFAAAFAACFLGGASPLPSLAGHGVALLVGLGVLAVKVAVVTWLVQRLQAAFSGSRARAALRFLERAAIPLVLVNLLVTSAYALLR